MKTKLLLLVFAVVFATANLHAGGFTVDGIAYTVTSSTSPYSVAVTSGGTYTGAITIPTMVSYYSINYSVTSIGVSAFAYCTGLTSVTIPNSVTSIGSAAFAGCSGLSSVTIPNSVTSIVNPAFAGCNGLFYVDANNPNYSSINGVLYNKNQTTILQCPMSKTGSFVIPVSVTSIGVGAFLVCKGLTSITIPNSVTSIGDQAFMNCTGLTSVTIPNSVTSIGGSAFSYCKGLTSVTIGNSVTSIGSGAFKQCRGLTSITIPNSVTSIGAGAFQECSGLTSITIPNSVTSIEDWAFAYCAGLTSITIGNSVTSIGGYAFYYCRGLTSVTIPNSVTSIGDGAFNGCNGITSVTIPNLVTSIGYATFGDCSGLTSVTIPNSVTSIGKEAFIRCSGLTAVTIPNSVNSIGISAFAYCTGLTSVTIPNLVTSIGEETFYSCSGLTAITIPKSVTSIGFWAFVNCSGLFNVDANNLKYSSINGVLYNKDQTTLIQCTISQTGNFVIPLSVTSIGVSAFAFCTGITSVTIPNSVTSIGGSAFYYCIGLTSIYADSPTPVNLSGSSFVFNSVNTTTCTLYVPTDTKSLYAAANQWIDFKNIVEHTIAGITTNDEFDNGTQKWNLSTFATGATATMKIDANSVISGTNSCAVTISQTTGTDWHIQLWQWLTVYNKHKYTITFKAKASAARSIVLALQKGVSPYTTYLNKTHNLTTSVQTFTDEVTMTATDLAKLQFYFGSSTASVWIDDITIVDTDLTTGIEEPGAANGNTSVLQNYPNPFNTTTTIKYKVTEPGFVSLKVFNAMGTEVATLVNEKKPIGEFTIELNATGLSDGIYFCRLQEGLISETKKLVLHK